MVLLKNKKIILIIALLTLASIAIVFYLLRPAPPVAKTKSTTVDTVLIGDATLLGPFADSFIRNLNLREDQRAVFAVSNATFSTWLNGSFAEPTGPYKFQRPGRSEVMGSAAIPAYAKTKLHDVLVDTKPTRIVFALGTEDFKISSAKDDSNEKASKTVVMQIRNKLQNVMMTQRNAKCYWLGPVTKHNTDITIEKQDRLINELKYAVSSTRCVYLDSRDIAPFDAKKSQSAKNCAPKKNQKFYLDTKDSEAVTQSKESYRGYCLAQNLKIN